MNAPFGLTGNGPVQRYEQREAQGLLPRGWISGLTLSNDSTDATNDIAISAGVCRSTVNIVDGVPSTRTCDQVDLEIPVQIIKQLDVEWAPENYDPEGYSGGGRSGGRSQSSVSNTTWHVYAAGAAGLPADILFHDSATQSSVLAALPGAFTAYRRIGSVIRLSGALLLFTQNKDSFRLRMPIRDVSSSTISTTESACILSVPVGLTLLVDLNVRISNAGSSADIYLRHPSDEDSQPSGSVAPMSTLSSAGAGSPAAAQARVWCNTSAQIMARASASSTTLIVATCGWWDARGHE